MEVVASWFNETYIECFTTTFLRAHSWLNWVNETSSSSSDNVELGSSTYPIEIDSSSIPNQVS